jgi:hypothetical protein
MLTDLVLDIAYAWGVGVQVRAKEVGSLLCAYDTHWQDLL